MTEAPVVHELTLTRLINVPRAKLFRCWTEPALITQWFTPPPWKTIAAETDVRAGGASLITMQGPDGTLMPNRGVYLEVVKDERIVFTDAFTGDWNTKDGVPFFVGVVEFAPEGGKTRYTCTVRHWTEEARADHEARGFYTGWGIVADQLEALAKTI